MNALIISRSGVRSRLDKRLSAHRDASPGAAVAATIFPSDLGWMAIAGRNGAVVSIDFGYPSKERATKVLASRWSRTTSIGDGLRSEKWLHDVASLLTRYSVGHVVDFSDVVVDLEHLTPFARRVVAACRNIPRGGMRTYGDLATECGSPGAARAVGSVMAKNRYPLIVPCHRVVGAAGSLGGYSAPEGLAMKRTLLALESASTGSTSIG
jgi:methylated-DNA-[protein]-cysteine S-methyltransferase